jgi:hypothetical protein
MIKRFFVPDHICLWNPDIRGFLQVTEWIFHKPILLGTNELSSYTHPGSGQNFASGILIEQTISNKRRI